MYMWHVYIVECFDGTLYTGITNNLEKRIETHNQGKGAKYTRGRRPVKLLCSVEREDRIAALRHEARVKKMPKNKKLMFLSYATGSIV